ncbi:MAG: 4Fe-4S cluster-binding domain-containing protein [Planctomycetia bacterium]|nr:4Fe-4S cluster-binding domain-containing protein [Planctomycetia bacterium]
MARTYGLKFKPTNQCNLRCTYCYAENLKSLNPKTMTLQEAKEVFDWVLKYCKEYNFDKLSVTWHGGEPLLPGAEFMEQCVVLYRTV